MRVDTIPSGSVDKNDGCVSWDVSMGLGFASRTTETSSSP